MHKMLYVLLAGITLIFSNCKKEDPKTDPPVVVPTKADTIAGLINSTSTTFIILRHAEKEATGTDPNLDSAGQARAQELKNLLSKIAVSGVYSTSYNRTRQTATPIATSKGLTVNEYATTTPYATLVSDIRAANKNKVAVIVGHSNTVPDILKQITNNAFVVTINDSQYDNLFIVNIKENLDATVVHMKYGVSTP